MSTRYDPLHNQTQLHEDVTDKLQRQRRITLYVGVVLGIALAVIVVLGVLYASERSSSPTCESAAEISNAAQLVQQNITGFILSQLNRAVDPCDDFYQFSCGGWLSSTPLPADKALSYLVIDPIEDANWQILRQVLESDLQWPMISDVYSECMSNATDVPLSQVTDFVNTAKMIDSLPNPLDDVHAAIILSRLHLGGAPAFFTFSVGADLLDSTLNIGQLNQGGFALPTPSYYAPGQDLSDYHAHIVNMFNFLNDAQVSTSRIDPNAAADNVINLERQLAAASWTTEQMRNLNATYNKKSPDDLKLLIPNILWSRYLTEMGLLTQTQNVWINVQVVQFAAEVNSLLGGDAVPLQHYLYWNLLHASAPYLNSSIQQENFNFFSKILNGIEQPEPKWKQCVETVDELLGQNSGRFYVEAAFNDASKVAATEMMNAVIQAMYKKIATVDWMDETTKANANKKLDQFTGFIGYPDHWDKYRGLALQYTSYYDDVNAIFQWQMKSQVSQIGLPVDRTVWSMTTPTVNAYYDPSTNHIVIPAGILQGYYFNLLFHPAINFGGTGGTLGHELTHAFDDQGSQFDGNGNYVNWWSPETLVNWNNRTGCLLDYYSAFTVNGTHVNGSLTLGENIADCGGIKQAFAAYHDFMAKFPHSVPGIDVSQPYLPGYTNDQLFFIAYAQGWCAEYSPEYVQIMLADNPHSPSEFRVNGPLAQFDQFSKVFNCPANSKMNLKNRCDVW